MRDELLGLQTLVLPFGASPGSPRIIIGPDIPIELVTWGNANNVTFQAVIVYYFDATHYTWEGIGTFFAQVTKFEGTWDSTNDVYITRRTVLNAPPGGYPSIETRIGSSILNTFPYSYVFQRAAIAIQQDSSFTIDGKSAPRGLIDFVSSTADSAAIAAETVILTGNTVSFQDGRAFAVICENDLQSTANNFTEVAVRRNGIAGTLLRFPWGIDLERTGFGHTLHAAAIIQNTSGATITDKIVTTLKCSAGTSTAKAAANRLRYQRIMDIGAAADYPNAVQI